MQVPTINEHQRSTRCCQGDIGLEPWRTIEQAQDLSDDLQILAHPIRLLILHVLAENEGRVCVCDLEATVPVKQPTISHHLKLLRDAGLVEDERHGQWSYYIVRRRELADLRERIAARLGTLT